ncbi:predicted protein [Streptomyces iranensis]|uniref:Uncharacterized protein n=1 Tax=Streptomyces iranensis TaxID=576784 RepID=A0A060ZIG4_9ACTN|nr:predicted protein [Streptomyces iranensis]
MNAFAGGLVAVRTQARRMTGG